MRKLKRKKLELVSYDKTYIDDDDDHDDDSDDGVCRIDEE